MKLVLWIAAVVCASVATYVIPATLLPASIANNYYKLFGERTYTEAPPNQQPNIPPLDMDVVCPPHLRDWREAKQIEGVDVEASPDCVPDNPWEIAASVLGTNNISHMTLMRTLFAPDAVEKSEDRDGDGDPDLITIRLEVMELNGYSPDMPDVIPQFEIAPGIKPGIWVFTPKSRDMSTVNFGSLEANRLLRLPAPVIRVEQGDEVRVILENTHSLPHTIHLHGVDHPFQDAKGEGNDGVPMFSEMPVKPGEARTYEFKPRQPGTMFYHCHVQPQAHILMGLQGMIIVEENRPNNPIQTLNIGAGRVRAPSVAVRETYDREYDLQYTDIDKEMNDRIKKFNDPRLVSRAIHNDYKIADWSADYYLLNGRSFPYTLKESLIIVEPGQRAKLRVINTGVSGVALHPHGHKVITTHIDGIPVPEAQRSHRDVVWIPSAQRVDLELNSTNDGLNNYGAGAWLMHDHKEPAVTTAGMNPGGDVSLIVYLDFLDESGLPKTVMGPDGLAPYFSPAYYRGEIPVFAADHETRFLDPMPQSGGTARMFIFVLALVGTIGFAASAIFLRGR